MNSKLQKEIESLHATSHEVGSKWLAAAMHPPTKSDNPGYPDSDRAASVRTNSNINYTIAPPGACSKNPEATWNCSIITIPNNPYHPGVIVAYLTDEFNLVQELISYVRNGPAPGPDDGITSPVYYDLVNGTNIDVGYKKYSGTVQAVHASHEDCVVYFRSVKDNYMPASSEISGWRCIGASNTTYLDCAEMFKQGVTYGSHAPRPAIRTVPGMATLGSYKAVGQQVEDVTGQIHNYDEAVMEQLQFAGLSTIFPSDVVGKSFTKFPGASEDTTYNITEFSHSGIKYTVSNYTVTPGAVTIVAEAFGYQPGDAININGTNGSKVILEKDGQVQKVNGQAYITAMVNGNITGPQLTQSNLPGMLSTSEAKDFAILNGFVKDKGAWYVGNGQQFMVLTTFNGNTLGGPVVDTAVPGSVTSFPLDRQSMQANSEMMQHEAKNGSYQVSRLLDSENPYAIASACSNVQVVSGDGKTEVLNRVKCDLLNFQSKSANSALLGANTFIAPIKDNISGAKAITSSHQGPLIGGHLDYIGFEDNAKTGEEHFPQYYDHDSLPSTSAWSSPVVLYVGLSSRSSIQAKICRDLEIVPTANSALAPLSSVGAISDEKAIYNGVLLLNNIPVLLSHKDNDLGSFLKAAWTAIKAASPAIIAGSTAAFGPAGGAIAGSALASAKAVEKLVMDIRKLKQDVNANTTARRSRR